MIASCRVLRNGALMRGLLWAAGAIVCGAAVIVVFRSLDFSAAGGSWRLVDVSIFIVMLPVAVAALYLAVLGLRWIALAIWPGFVGAVASQEALTLCFGPFGTRRFDASQLEVCYPFELDEDEDGGFEALLPQEKQLATLLPRLTHPSSAEYLNLVLLKFLQRPEAELVQFLRPALDAWRSTGNETDPADRPAPEGGHGHL